MKIIISPSKTQDTNTTINAEIDQSKYQLAIQLLKKIKSYDKNQLAKALKIKGTLLDKTYDLYQTYQIENPKIPAIECYKGVVFSQLNLDTYQSSNIDYLQKHLVILSAMYGCLEPSTLIWPYRLDMTAKLSNINLYQYWQDTIDHYFKNEDVIINLASNEFSKMINSSKNNLINIYFLEEKNGKLKAISFNAKKARGMMLNKLIEHKVKDITTIKKFVVDGYTYNSKMSDQQHYYFTKYQGGYIHGINKTKKESLY